VAYPPAPPDRSALREDELDAYDRVIARQAAYDYAPFVERFLHESVLRAFPGDRLQPYFAALLNSPLIADGISELGVVHRTRGSYSDSYDQADREWIDMVLCDEVRCNWVLYVHAPDAVASGVRPEAIDAVVDGREWELAADEKEKADYIPSFVRGTVTQPQYARLEVSFGVRGMVEWTAFCGHLLMTMRLIQALGLPDIPHADLEELVDALVERRVELPAGARVPATTR
jgi:hypothetical protein